MGGASPPCLKVDPCVELADAGGVRVAVLGHTHTRDLAQVLLRAYQQNGAQGIHERAADCSAIVADASSHTLVLARDKLGITPVYYGGGPNLFAFGTRIRDVLPALPQRPPPNRAALAALLVDRSAAPPGQTYFQNVHSVPPGGTVVQHTDTIRTLSPSHEPGSPAQRIGYAQAVEQFREHLRNAVTRRLDAQRPTAVLVSGGLDSSALIALAAQSGDVFGITYGPQGDTAADESRYIDELRAHGLRIERLPFYPIIDIAAFEQSVRDAEMPEADVLPLLSRRAAHAAHALGARVLMQGTWGDQVLAPFPPSHLARLSPWRAAKLAAPFQQYMADVSEREIRMALVRQSMRARAPWWLLRARQRRGRRAHMFDVLSREFAPAQLPATAFSYADAVSANVRAPAQLQAIEATFKWGQSSGLDARLPFLDYELVQFLASLPDDVAYHEHRLKPLLRDALKGILPKAIVERRDKGDYTAALQRHQLPSQTVLDLLEELRRPVEFGLMSGRSAAKTLARLHRATDISDAQDELMVLLSVDTWLRLFFQNGL